MELAAVSSLTLAVFVGVVWGLTNTCMRWGVLKAERPAVQHSRWHQHLTRVTGSHWSALLTTPAFVASQMINWAASALLVASLADSKLHIATPVANAVSIAVTAATGQLIANDCKKPGLLVGGVVCIAAGAALCGT